MSQEPVSTPSQNPAEDGAQSRPTGNASSRKRKRVARGEEDKENHEAQRKIQAGEATSFTDSAYQSMNTEEDGLSMEERKALLDTPSKKRVRRTPASKPTSSARRTSAKNALDQGEAEDSAPQEESVQDTVVVDTPSRTSTRKRKQTWKAADVEESPPPQAPPTKTATPTSRKRTKATPKSKKSAAEKTLTAGLSEASVPETPNTQRQTPALDASASLRSPQELASASLAALPQLLSVGQAEEPSAVVTPTPTPRKRKQPAKDKALDSPSGLLSGTPSKRSKKINPLLDVSGIASSPSTPSRKKTKAIPETQVVPPVSWQQYKEHGVDQNIEWPNIDASHQALKTLLEQPRFAAPLKELRLSVLRYLTGQSSLPLQGLDEEYEKVRSVVQQTVAAGEGNSMLLIGPRGSGKTAMVNQIMAEMRSSDNALCRDFHLIRLNGFIHTDDKVALREIWRQLGREMQVDDESMLERSNYADTLSSLLAVLSHPTEQPEAAQETSEESVAKSVVFVIDEFDLFTTHARQTLLYNLFDIAQSRKAPICVLGLTTRVDVAETLEKRVKSRFSHRYVFLARPKSFFAYQQVVLLALKAGQGKKTDSNEQDSNIDPALTIMDVDSSNKPAPSADYQTLHSAWSTYITSLFAPSTHLTSMLRLLYATSRSVPMALTSFLIPLTQFTTASRIPTDISLSSSPLLPSDSKLSLLPSLTEVELTLLIAAARLDLILDVDTANFNMAYDEYTTLADRVRQQTSASGAFAVASGGAGGGARFWSREAALAAWERLEILELIMPMATAGYGAGSGLADVGRAGRLMRCDVSLEEIRWAGLDLSGQMAKWCKEI